MIRNFKQADLDVLMELWLVTNISAHAFITKDYWIMNYNKVKDMLPKAIIYVYEETEGILGFIGLIEDTVAGIFVSGEHQSKSIGKNLLDGAKREHKQLSLSVYRKNKRAIKFYLKEGFQITQEQVDKTTGEVELQMSWKQ